MQTEMARNETWSPPLPLRDAPWRGEAKAWADAFWEWHLACWESLRTGRKPESVVFQRALEAAKASAAPLDLVHEQAEAVASARRPFSFESAQELREFVRAFAGSHARLLAHLAGARGGWQQPWIEELAFGFFLTGRLIALPADVEQGMFFIAGEGLDAAGLKHPVSFTENEAAARKLLWKQIIRARDAFAQGQPLIEELEPHYARVLKRYWFGALELLREIERRDFDVWSKPVSLSLFRRFQVGVQSRFGRSIFSR